MTSAHQLIRESTNLQVIQTLMAIALYLRPKNLDVKHHLSHRQPIELYLKNISVVSIKTESDDQSRELGIGTRKMV